MSAHMTLRDLYLPADSIPPACREDGGDHVVPQRHIEDLRTLLDANWRFLTRPFGTPIPRTTAPTLYGDRFYGLRALDLTRFGKDRQVTR